MKLKSNLKSIRWLVIAGLGTALTACGGNFDDLYTYIDDVKAKPGGEIDPLPQPKPAPSFVYEPGDRRSPFMAEDLRPVGGNDDPDAVDGPDQNRVLEFLEGSPLDSLTMVGTLGNADGYFGLVQDSDGLVHPVTVGNHMGFDYGRIVAISESEIQLVEIVTDGLGGWRERPAIVRIPDSQ